jgi:hypothetical protein
MMIRRPTAATGRAVSQHMPANGEAVRTFTAQVAAIPHPLADAKPVMENIRRLEDLAALYEIDKVRRSNDPERMRRLWDRMKRSRASEVVSAVRALYALVCALTRLGLGLKPADEPAASTAGHPAGVGTWRPADHRPTPLDRLASVSALRAPPAALA